MRRDWLLTGVVLAATDFVSSSSPLIVNRPAPHFHFNSAPLRLNHIRSNFYLRQRRHLPMGEPVNSQDVTIDSIPVENRMNCLKFLSSDVRRGKAHSLPVSCGGGGLSHDYHQHILSTKHVEIGILRLLYRYAFGGTLPTEKHLTSATEIVEHLQTLFLTQYNYSLEFLTPSMLMYWYMIVGDGKFALFMYHPDSSHRDATLPDTELVTITPRAWREGIVERRLHNLQITGYETHM